MKRKVFILLCFLGCQKVSNHTIQESILSLKNKWVSDKREAVWQIESTAKAIKGEVDQEKLYLALQRFAQDKGLDFQVALLPAKHLGNKIWGLINLSVANIRAEPKHAAELTTQALMGMPVKVLKQKGTWYYIQTPDKYLGWIDSYGLHRMTLQQMKLWRQKQRYFVVQDLSDVSGKKGTVTDLGMGNIVEQKGVGTYGLPDGREVLLKKEMLQDLSTFAMEWRQDKAIDLAKRLVGKPYLWGGTSTKGMDCSGFTKTVFYQQGFLLRRDASLQFLVGEKIENKKYLEKGDLLFWGNYRKDGSQRITHVGIYDQDQTFIHASGRVRVNSLDSTKEHYEPDRTLMGIRRMKGVENTKGFISIKKHPWYYEL